jgi:tRNA 2-selenouridine synthase
MQYLSIEDFIQMSVDVPVIDVRSEAEYLHAHIPGAHNIQLFNNEERAEIGLIYKLQGSKDAISKGLEMVGPKFDHYFDQLSSITPKKQILIYCWRGGMRSSSLAWLYETAGYECFVLNKGYKAFRNHILEAFAKPVKIFILGGKTGSGKTEILKNMAEKGEQVLDLEYYANHKGSAFGHLGQPPQPSSEYFENQLFMEWNKFDLTKPIWIEDENQQIGNIFIPKPLWLQMQVSQVFMIDVSPETRLIRLMLDYSCFNTEYLIGCFEKISRRIGSENSKTAVDCLKNDDLTTACQIVLKYYDKAYLNSLSKKNQELVNMVKCNDMDLGKISEMLMAKASFND